MTDWRELYKATVLETNPTRLERLIAETEGAILVRLQELDRSSDGAGERHEMELASAALDALKIDKLFWPRNPPSGTTPRTD